MGRNVKAVLLPGLRGTAGSQVRLACAGGVSRAAPAGRLRKAHVSAQTLTAWRDAQALRDWDLWGPLIFTMTLVRPSCTAGRRGRGLRLLLCCALER